MEVVIVGRRNGRRVIRWAAVAALAARLSAVFALGFGGVNRLLSGQWAARPFWLGAAAGVAIVAVGIVKSLGTPLDKLQDLE